MYRQTLGNLGKIFFRKVRFPSKTDSQKRIDKKFYKKNQEFFIDKKHPEFFGVFLLDTSFLSDAPSCKCITCFAWLMRLIWDGNNTIVSTSLSSSLNGHQ